MDFEWGEEGETDGDEANSCEDAEINGHNIADSGVESNWDDIKGSRDTLSNIIHEEDVNLHTRRETITPSWIRDHVSGEGLSEEETELNMAIVTSVDPLSYEEAVKSYNWKEVMDAKIQSIQRNETWSLTELPAGAKKIGVKWIYKTKLNEFGEVDKFKARLVAKGYAQQHGVDYIEVFASVARMDTIRMLIALAAQRSWLIYQLDVKSAFLHRELSEDLFVEQPKGYEQKGNEHKVYKLHKALYGLKQAPRAWFSRIETYFTHEGFQKCISEQTLFVKQISGGKILIVSVYVDDLIFTRDDEQMMLEFKKSMMKVFDMTGLGKMRFFLGI